MEYILLVLSYGAFFASILIFMLSFMLALMGKWGHLLAWLFVVYSRMTSFTFIAMAGKDISDFEVMQFWIQKLMNGNLEAYWIVVLDFITLLIAVFQSRQFMRAVKSKWQEKVLSSNRD